MKIVFEDNSFIGVSVDEYNNKEYVISSENGTETYFTEKTGDFLSKHFCYTDLLLTPSFYEAQKHMKLNSEHQYDVLDVLKISSPDIISEWEAAYYSNICVGKVFLLYRNGQQYLIAEKNQTAQITLIIGYINKLYAQGLFPRLCMNCGSLFLSGKRHGNVLCSDSCKRKGKVKNTMDYYGRHSENDRFYLNIYRKWYQRIKRAADNKSVDQADLDLLRRRLNQLTFMHKTAADKRKAGTFDETEWHESLLNYDTEFYKLWDKIKKTNFPPGNLIGGK